ncbi:sulfite exporter TauE/SafE family protein [Flavilitoribacter nigricans]|uniref:Probable membrane transporter protein n=1 Tax=Flavilitoribacter nigricans (strain ATCC 23147 / DSM 23189 / NBRC 102662 / NCIMB 1420 / SS-2) TaxID=1122177 RepID=A0A2D0NDZ1_FLAN2|nr:sulfite exporter TauE/SafE family protein [Flavilitoribacter nigricans]PHN06586.1 hypothetical protein CRP01_09785 [Flavilitoribacter nigricans DSM 23189 = NBRC 102662]
MEITKIIAALFVGIFAGFIGAMVGSGGLISIPFLIFLGLPPQVAIATHKFGSAGLKIGAAVKFWKTKYIHWQYFLPFSIMGFVAAIVGAQILLSIDKELLSRMVAILLILVLPLIFLNKEAGVIHRTTSTLKRGFGYFLYFLAQIFGAFFGGGAATMVFYILMTFFGLTIVEASATTMLPSLITSLVALIIFGINDLLNYQIGLLIFLGMLTGGWLGAHVAIKKGNIWVKALFAITVVFSAIKLLLG